MFNSTQTRLGVALIGLVVIASIATAEPLAAPGDLRLRHDLQLLSDHGVINVPLTAWPVSLGEIHNAVANADRSRVGDSLADAWERVSHRAAWELETGSLRYEMSLSAAENPRQVRSFEYTPREEGEVMAGLSWLGDRFTVNLRARYAASPFDGEEFRPDGTYVGAALGNWMVTAGWQERWWGPSRDSSLILGTNARPAPGIALQRIASTPFDTKWLSWMGPWTFTTFMSHLDDERFVKNALLFGARGSIRPPRTGLEIGFSRTAQWCGDGRPCDAKAFFNLLVGKDNRGVNIDFENEPGNQLGGFDVRWTLPRQLPVALYMQWIGEDGRKGGGLVGNWLRQLGAEHWGTIGGLSHRTHIEVSDSMCHQGGFGFSEALPNCAYNHFIYETGYRYRGRSIGHPADADSLSYSLGSTLVQSAGHVWSISLRHIEINREGTPNPRHTLTPTRQDLTDLQVAHERETRIGRFYAGLGYSRLEDKVSGGTESNFAAFLQWSSR